MNNSIILPQYYASYQHQENKKKKKRKKLDNLIHGWQIHTENISHFWNVEGGEGGGR